MQVGCAEPSRLLSCWVVRNKVKKWRGRALPGEWMLWVGAAWSLKCRSIAPTAECMSRGTTHSNGGLLILNRIEADAGLLTIVYWIFSPEDEVSGVATAAPTSKRRDWISISLFSRNYTMKITRENNYISCKLFLESKQCSTPKTALSSSWLPSAWKIISDFDLRSPLYN